jgi:hypothetical protein
MAIDKSGRRDAVRAYKERKQQRGVFAVTCAPTGERWVAATHNLDKQQNMTWFTLRQGAHPNRTLQAAWTAHGETAFSYDILDTLQDDLSDADIIRAELKDMEALWREELGARRVTG